MRVSVLLILFAAVALSGCAGTPGPGDSEYPFNVAGSYLGRFVFQDQRFEATMQLRTVAGGRVSGGFRVSAPVEIDGRAEGAVVDDLLRLTITYVDSAGCDGRIEGLLTVDQGGGIFEGPVTVSDCGNPVSGSMSFRRVERRPGGLEER
jgi:hypothetical protein